MAKGKTKLSDIDMPTQGLNPEYIQTLIRRKDLLEFVEGSYPNYEAGWVHKDICARLEKFSQDIIDGKNPRLMLFLPPRHGKSFLSSERFPVWHIGNNPDHNVIVSSYSADLSSSFSKKALDLAQDPYVRKIFPELVLDENKQAADEWATRSGGGYKSVGVGGSLTGRGAHCFVGGTKVSTEIGQVTIRTLHILSSNGLNTPLVLSFNHDKGIIEHKQIICSKVSNANILVEKRTASSNNILSTLEHRVCTDPTNGTYTEAKDVHVGDALFSLPFGVRDQPCGLCEEDSSSIESFVLLLVALLEDSPLVQEQQALRILQKDLSRPWTKVLLQRVCEIAQGVLESKAIEMLRGRIVHEQLCYKLLETEVLLNGMQEQEPFFIDEGSWEFPSQRRDFSDLFVSKNKEGCISKGQDEVYGLRYFGKPVCSSQRPQPQEQRHGKSCNDVQTVPHNTPQIFKDKVTSSIEIELCDTSVYDIQVYGNHNFFANGVLVHNCLIIDDPIKDWEQASSQAVRTKVWNWYLSTAYTRLMPKSGVLVIQTRWHEEDLAGLLLKEMEDQADDPHADKWEVISYPAIALHDEEHRLAGEALHPERYDISKLEKIKKAVGPRVWTALYQQQPRPDGGRYIDSGWFNRVTYDRVPKALNWVRGWDLAVKAKKSNDETASSKVALDEDGNLWVAEQVSYKKVWGASKETIVDIALKEGITIGIESPGAMTIAIDEIKLSLTGSGIPVKEVFPDKDKLTRALPWIDLAERGKVFLVEGGWVQKFLNQAEAFDPMQKDQADDLIDSLTVAYEIIKKRRKARLIV